MKMVNVKAADVELAYTGSGFRPVHGPAVVHYAGYGETVRLIKGWRTEIQNDSEQAVDYNTKMAEFKGNKGEKLMYEGRYLNETIGHIDHLFVEDRKPSFSKTIYDIITGQNLLTIAKNIIAANTYK